jgi:large subunit ribosomal protein L28e
MSADLVWSVIRNNSSFLVKRGGSQFSSEPGNLLNVNSFKYSGVANARTVDVAATADNKGVVLAKKKAASRRRPGNLTLVCNCLPLLATSLAKTTHKKGYRRVAKGLAAELKNFRPDLKKAALSRASRLVRSSKVFYYNNIYLILQFCVDDVSFL